VTAALVDRLLAAARELTGEVLAEMYRDRFWYARFGELRASRHGQEDGDHHVEYLVEALRAEDAGVIERYARWLQQVLTTRGMCTRHLADHFERLGVAIAARGWPDGDRAVKLLAAAVAALRYQRGPARAVQDRADAIAGDDAELATLVSYLADAAALGRPMVFTDHAVWYADFIAREGGSRSRVTALLQRLRETVESQLPECHGSLAPILDEAAVTISHKQ
jgi:hypothetical protein